MRTLALLAAALLLPAPALAVDLTGTWLGGFQCSDFDGVKLKYSQPDEILEISQQGSALNIDWLEVADLQGLAVSDDRKPQAKGTVAMIDCGTGTDLTTGYAELAVLQVKIDRAKGKGSLKGESFYTADGELIGSCKWKFTLVDTADPGAPGC